jgi:hypothetical protein
MTFITFKMLSYKKIKLILFYKLLKYIIITIYHQTDLFLDFIIIFSNLTSYNSLFRAFIIVFISYISISIQIFSIEFN